MNLSFSYNFDSLIKYLLNERHLLHLSILLYKILVWKYQQVSNWPSVSMSYLLLEWVLGVYQSVLFKCQYENLLIELITYDNEVTLNPDSIPAWHILLPEWIVNNYYSHSSVTIAYLGIHYLQERLVWTFSTPLNWIVNSK